MRNSRAKPSCKAKAVDLLARSDQSKQRLTDKLKHAKYSEEEIEATMQWLEEKHYINDEACCHRRFQYMYEDSSYSIKQICAKLMQQGFNSDLVSACIPADTYERELKAARKVLSSKYKPGMDFKKLMQYSYMKGFSYDVGKTAAEELVDSSDFD